jgi:hypothetical protein
VSNGESFFATFSQNRYLKFNVNNWNVSNGKNFSYMFEQTKKQKDIDLSKWDVSNGRNFKAMFLIRKESVFGVANWNLNCAEDISNMFEFCNNFIENISNWDWSKIKNIKYNSFLDNCDNFDFSILKDTGIDILTATSSWFFYLKMK